MDSEEQLEAFTCDNDTSTPDYKFPIEARLVKYLRMWRDDANSETVNGRKVEQEIAFLVEWYICECIPYGPNNLGGWWSDGVIHLEIGETAQDTFRLLGVTWIGCHGIAPFEIDVELDPGDERRFAKTIFRIGMLDDRGFPKILHPDRYPGRVLELRPSKNQDWAMAIELTPPEHKSNIGAPLGDG